MSGLRKEQERTLQIKLLLSDHIWCTRHVWHDYPWMWPCLCTQQRVWDSKSDRVSSPKWILNNKRGLWSACIRFLSNLFLPLFCSLHWLFRIECVFYSTWLRKFPVDLRIIFSCLVELAALGFWIIYGLEQLHLCFSFYLLAVERQEIY